MDFIHTLQRVENRPYYPTKLVLPPISVATVRVVLNHVLFGQPLTLPVYAVTLAWYFCLFAMIICSMSIAMRVSWRKMLHPAAYALYFGVLPPVIDFFVAGSGTTWYPHALNDASIVGHDLFVYPLGEYLVWAMGVGSAFVYASLRSSKKLSRWYAAGLIGLSFFLLMYAVPSLTWALSGMSRLVQTWQLQLLFLCGLTVCYATLTSIFVVRNEKVRLSCVSSVTSN